jgi:hypothetical protein
MDLLTLTALAVLLALIFSLAAFGRRLQTFNTLARPVDRSAPKGAAAAGVRYAFTLGMAPWAKESTRRHWAAYLRGIGFHLGIFLGLAVLLGGHWLPLLPLTWRYGLGAALGAGALLGLGGLVARLVERNLRALSTADDYFAVFLVSVFLALGAAVLFYLPLLPVFFTAGAVLLVYAPLGKIRHCIYYAYSRLFFGRYFGRRAVLPHAQQGVAR